MLFLNKSRFLAWILALGVGAMGGCHHIEADPWVANDPEAYLAYAAAYVALAIPVAQLSVIGTAIQQSASDTPARSPLERSTRSQSPTRTLQVLRGGLYGSDGRPLAGATLKVRAAPHFLPSPESLPALTLQTAADGSYAVPMADVAALCVDYAAPGMRSERRWFVVLTEDALEGLPADTRAINFVSPLAPEARAARLYLTVE